MPWRFSYKSLKFLPAAFSVLHPVMQELPWGGSRGLCDPSFWIYQLIYQCLCKSWRQSLVYCCPPSVLSVYSINSCTVGQEGKLPFMWAFLIFVWLLVPGWGFFFLPLWYNIHSEGGGNILNTGRCVSWVLSAVCFQVHLFLLRGIQYHAYWQSPLSVLLLVSLTCTSIQRLQRAPVLLSWEVLLAPMVNYGQPQGLCSLKGRGRASISFLWVFLFHVFYHSA